jgi:uncharacterized protein YndB with AHSA1/START domain
MAAESSLTVTMPSEREVTIARVFDVPRALVWKAYTSPEHLPHWMLGPPGWTMPVCEMDLRPGGKWRWAWRHDNGQEMEMRGVYIEVVPPERVMSTESWGGDWPETTNTVTFTEEDGRATLTITILYPSKEAREAAMKTGMTKGMEMSYDRLAAHLETLS